MVEALAVPVEKPPLDKETLADIIDLSLWVGQILLQHGSESQRVEETVHRVGTALGCDWMDVFISLNTLIVTTSSHGDFRTKIRRVVSRGVNMASITAINDLSRRIELGECDRVAVRKELERISHAPLHYNRWLVCLTVGLACAAGSRMFGGDLASFGVTWIAAGGAMFVRQELGKAHFNHYLIALMTAFAAGGIASLGISLGFSEHAEITLAASVLLLVPGVQLINAIDDLVYGHTIVGVARGMLGGLIVLFTALGLLWAIGITGVHNL